MLSKFYKNNYKVFDNNLNDIQFQIIEWHAQDEDADEIEDSEMNNEKYTIRCFGVTSEGNSITCKITDFTPFYYIKVPDTFDKIKLYLLIKHIKESFQFKKKNDNDTWVSYYTDDLLENKCKIIKKKDLFGFRDGKMYKYIKLVFRSITAMNKSKYIFKNPVLIENVSSKAVKYKLYESNFDPFLRYCHLQDIQTAGWIELQKDKYTITNNEANTQIEVEINFKNVVSLKERKEIANFLQASWDIETYSFDGTFPEPNKKDNKGNFSNVIYQIATTFKYYKESDILVKHLLTLKKCDEIESEKNTEIIVEECETEKDLIKRWIDIIYEMDPDILYTYNGDCFDCMYLYERSKLYDLDNYLCLKLSRLVKTSVVVKKDTFSSSAYGDSDFVRFYIPGRLNYDLLIHYKRGMKKYPSYKLDFIANEILKHGKNDVTPKDIFKYYEDGSPDKIKIIGMYCLKDTSLLQDLVDNQLILITIIQLANVTYIPIGFLLTRGQTIKVFSQLLRKARQMNFLVPHTNFNEDTFPILVKTINAHNLEDNIDDYIEINCGKSQNGNKNNYNRDLKINGKISEIIDDNTFIVLSTIELEQEFFNVHFTIKNNTFYKVKISPGEDILDSSFTGATVLQANPGLYTENISVLDFASLYPTIMISRNLCYSTFISNEKYMPKSEENGRFNENGIEYERFQWDDKVEYKLNHTCQGVGKSGKGKDVICGKQAFFDVTLFQEYTKSKTEIDILYDEYTELIDVGEVADAKKLKVKIKTKEKNLKLLSNNINLIDKNAQNNHTSRYFCRIHDPVKSIREESEKHQKKDVTYNFTVVQTHINENGEKVNQGVLPAFLEELYAERKKVKKEMAKAAASGNKLLESILNSTQLAIKVSLNSTYGFLGRKQGNLILKELASIVTRVGRTLIEQSKEYAENAFIDYVKDNKLLVQKIQLNQELLDNIDNNEKDIILEQFKIENNKITEIKEIEKVHTKIQVQPPKKIKKLIQQKINF